jgi:hypothetical protein
MLRRESWRLIKQYEPSVADTAIAQRIVSAHPEEAGRERLGKEKGPFGSRTAQV